MQQPEQYRFLKDEDVRNELFTWWFNLHRQKQRGVSQQKQNGDRARLRRATRPDDVLLTEPFFRFLQKMPERWADPEEILTSAIIVAMLAHVEQNRNGLSFPTQLALPKVAGSKKPMVNIIRFQRLQKSKNPNEFFIRLMRVIHLADKSVNVISLADSIMHWMKEYRFGVDREPQERLAVRWATDYYTQLSNTERKG